MKTGIRRCGVLIFTILVIAGLYGLQRFAVSDESTTEEVWSWPVALPKTSDADIQRSAKRLATVLAMPDMLWLADSNPGCCLWLEVKQWNPNPSEPGYIVILQDGGGRVIASDAEQLNKAIDRIEGLRKVKGDRVTLPKGLFTNYQIIE
ncbi:MAG: hypothetical protein ACKVT0_23710 [Planctomycetaceae bacterium]